MAIQRQKFFMRDLCEITSSKRIFAADYQTEGVPFFRGKEITEKYNGALEISTELFIARSKFDEIKAKFGVPKAGDLLLTSVGTLGSTYVVRPGDEFYFKDGNITWFRNLKGLDSQYLHYWLSSPAGRAELKKCTIGSSQSAYTIVLLKEMCIDVPPLPTQRRIASILSGYDGLIENNTRRIAILEEMARRIYEEWFVRFRFPGHEQVKMVESEGGLIPEGWQLSRMGEAFATVLGGTPSRSKAEYWEEGTVPWINSGKVNELRIHEPSEMITELGLRKSAAKLMPEGTTVLAITGATLGQVSILGATMCANQSVVGITDPSGVHNEYIYRTIQSRIESIIQRASGGAQQHINKEIVNEVFIALPDPGTLLAFNNAMVPLGRLISTLMKKNIVLRATRDLLLPKLISGELDVSSLPEPAVIAA